LKRLLIATGNKGKVKEIRQILAGSDIEVQSLADYPDVPEAIEDADTFLGNAIKKASHYQEHLKVPTIADDSGLVVDALDGAPGVYSARYAGEPGNDRNNNEKLLKELATAGALRPEQRKAKFVCAMVYLDGGTMYSAQGEVQGHIGDEFKGSNGFGYDPLFMVEDTGFTAAELPPEKKNAVSHRGRALRLLIEKLRINGVL